MQFGLTSRDSAVPKRSRHMRVSFEAPEQHMLSKVQEDSLYAGNSGEVAGNRDITENRFDDFGDEGDDLSSSDDDSYENRDFVQLNEDTTAIA